jgi:hypothetical protein
MDFLGNDVTGIEWIYFGNIENPERIKCGI